MQPAGGLTAGTSSIKCTPGLPSMRHMPPDCQVDPGDAQAQEFKGLIQARLAFTT